MYRHQARHPIHLSKLPGGFLIFLIFLIFAGTLVRAEPLPAIPPSSRILTKELVTNFWINTLASKPVPPKPNGLHPERQAAWARALHHRNSMIRSIRNGEWESEALLVLHTHNATAWRMRGNETAALAEDARLRELQLHLARLDTLEIQRRAAQSTIDTESRIRQIQAELDSLEACRSSCPDRR